MIDNLFWRLSALVLALALPGSAPGATPEASAAHPVDKAIEHAVRSMHVEFDRAPRAPQQASCTAFASRVLLELAYQNQTGRSSGPPYLAGDGIVWNQHGVTLDARDRASGLPKSLMWMQFETANQMNDWLHREGPKYGWRRMTAREAQERANRRVDYHVVVASWKNPDALMPGHVAVVRSGGLTADGPTIVNVGGRNFETGPVRQGFGNNEPEYWGISLKNFGEMVESQLRENAPATKPGPTGRLPVGPPGKAEPGKDANAQPSEDVVAEFRRTWPAVLERELGRNPQHSRVEMIANAAAVGLNQYRCAYNWWCWIKTSQGRRESVGYRQDRVLSLESLKSDLALWKRLYGPPKK